MEKLSVIKVGGAVVEDPSALENLLDAFASVEGYKILVHGGGREATRVSGLLGIESLMVDGRRVTDAATLEVVTMVYAGKVNKMIVAGLQKRHVKAIGLTGADMDCITSIKRPAGKVDYGFVGDIKKVDEEFLSSILKMDAVPVMVPITSDGCGQLLNTNADSVASAVASAMAGMFEVSLVMCFEKKGVLSDPDDEESVIPLIDRKIYEKMVREGSVSGGMLPKLDNAFEALGKGVSRVIVTSSQMIGQKDAGTTIVL